MAAIWEPAVNRTHSTDCASHRTYRSIYLKPGCSVVSHRHCATLRSSADCEIDPVFPESAVARSHVHAVHDSERIPSSQWIPAEEELGTVSF